LLLVGGFWIFEAGGWLFIWSNNKDVIAYGDFAIEIAMMSLVVASFLFISQFYRYRKRRKNF